MFFYGHPTNRFWPLLSQKYGSKPLASIEEKKELCKTKRIALYDVIESCLVSGSSDSSITDVAPADLYGLLKGHDIKRIILNGKLAAKLFKKHFPDLLDKAVFLPSTSAANAAFSMADLCEAWFAFLP